MLLVRTHILDIWNMLAELETKSLGNVRAQQIVENANNRPNQADCGLHNKVEDFA